MIPYFLPIILYLLYTTFNLNKRIIINLISLSIFLLLALRENVGYDYVNYSELYKAGFLPVEPLSKLLTNFSFIFDDYHFYFFIFSLITIYIIRRVAIINDSVIFLVVYICLPGFYIESFSLVRQTLAQSLVIYGYCLYRSDKNYYKIPLILACLTHFSAILFVTCFFLLTIFKRKKIVIVIILATSSILLSVFISYFTVYFPRLSYYQGDNEYGFDQFIFYLVLFLVIFSNLFKNNKTEFYLIFLGLCFMFSGISIDGVFIRMTYYFLIPFLFYKWNYIFNSKEINSLFWMTLFIFLFFYSLKIKTFNDDGSMVPYKTYLKL